LEKLYIGIAGTSEEPKPELLKAIDEFFEKLEIKDYKPVFVIGGYWGFMKYFADKAISRGYEVVFILPLEPPAIPPNNEHTVIIHTDLGFPTRSTIMCKTSDLLIVFGGKIGSMIEALLSYDFSRPVIILLTGYDTDKLCRAFTRYFDNRAKAQLYCVEKVSEAVRIVRDIAEKKKTYTSII
jgi:uncharacterized protein (TIGR00725 family)